MDDTQSCAADEKRTARLVSSTLERGTTFVRKPIKSLYVFLQTLFHFSDRKNLAKHTPIQIYH